MATPGSRDEVTTAVDNDGNLWLYGGYGEDANGNRGRLGDLWKYVIADNEWQFIHGSAFRNQNPAGHNDLGLFDANHTPGSRSGSSMWFDLNGDLYIFGGNVHNAGRRNDLWKYEVDNNRWAWIGGKNFGNDTGSTGIKGVEDGQQLTP